MEEEDDDIALSTLRLGEFLNIPNRLFRGVLSLKNSHRKKVLRKNNSGNVPRKQCRPLKWVSDLRAKKVLDIVEV